MIEELILEHTIEKLNIHNFSNEIKSISIGKLSDEFYRCLEDIPNILKYPDYVSIHPNDQSISFIKDYSGHTTVAIKIASDGIMSYRTMYPLTDEQLNNYINNGRAWKYE